MSGTVNFALLISGLRTADNFFNVNINQVSFNSQTGVFTVEVNTNANQSLEMIYLTYVIVLGNAPFTFVQYNPLVGGPAATYAFEGIDAITANSITYEGYALNFTASTPSTMPCLGSNCPSACVTPSRCASLNGITSNNQCFLCGFEETLFNGQCVSRCTGN